MASFRRNSLQNSGLSFLVGVWVYSFSRSHTFATLLLSPFVLAQQAPVDSGSEDGLEFVAPLVPEEELHCHGRLVVPCAGKRGPVFRDDHSLHSART
jgi:hypothetical protein